MAGESPLEKLEKDANPSGERIFRVLRGCVETGYPVSSAEVIKIIERGIASKRLSPEQLRGM